MALAFDEVTRVSPSETSVHLRTYRKFTVFATIGAFAVPVVLAFVLYWTT